MFIKTHFGKLKQVATMVEATGLGCCHSFYHANYEAGCGFNFCDISGYQFLLTCSSMYWNLKFVIHQSLDQVASVDMKQIMLVKALLVARDTLLEELQKLSKAIGQAIDLIDFTFNMDDMKMFDSIVQANLGIADGEISGEGKPQNDLEVLALYFFAADNSWFYFSFFMVALFTNIFFLFFERKQMAP